MKIAAVGPGFGTHMLAGYLVVSRYSYQDDQYHNPFGASVIGRRSRLGIHVQFTTW